MTGSLGTTAGYLLAVSRWAVVEVDRGCHAAADRGDGIAFGGLASDDAQGDAPAYAVHAAWAFQADVVGNCFRDSS